MKVVFLFTILVSCSIVFAENGFKISTKCEKCLKNTKTIADDIEKVAIDAGPFATCAALCEFVKNKTNSTVAGVVCEGLCGVVGLKLFKEYINNTELNYGKYCEKIKECPSGTGEGKLVSATVKSPIILGQNIEITILLSVSKESGLTQFVFECPKNKTTPHREYSSPLRVGGWKADWLIPTGKDWKVGNYTCDITVCDTICDSFPKDIQLGKKTLKFEIKKPKELIDLRV